MNIVDAANILGLSGSVTSKDVKRAYRKAAKIYHPDRNPAGSEMMKIVNAAFDVLKNYSGTFEHAESDTDQDYPEAVNTALNAIIDLAGLEIEICGAWVWVGGNTFAHKAALKAAAFKFAPKKKRWYFRPDDWSSRSRNSLSMDEIRGKYGSDRPKTGGKKYVGAS